MGVGHVILTVSLTCHVMDCHEESYKRIHVYMLKQISNDLQIFSYGKWKIYSILQVLGLLTDILK